MKLAPCSRGHDVRLTTRMYGGIPRCAACRAEDKAKYDAAHPQTMPETSKAELRKIAAEKKRRSVRIARPVDPSETLR